MRELIETKRKRERERERENKEMVHEGSRTRAKWRRGDGLM